MPSKSLSFKTFLEEIWIPSTFLISYMLIILLSCHFPFFWDNIVQASVVAHFYYDTNFSSILLPEEMDPGHPPFWGMTLAILWKIFGKSLWVGRILILPFAWGIVWQTYLLAKQHIDKQWLGWAMLLLLSDPTLLAQITQVSPDVALLFFFVWGVSSIVREKNGGLALASLGIMLFNLRGTILCAELFLISFAYRYINKRLTINSLILPFIPAALFVFAYYGYHFHERGWIRYHANSNWETEHEIASVIGLLKNAAVVGWRLVDFGRIFIWLAMSVLLLKIGLKNVWEIPKVKTILIMLACCLPLPIFLLLSSEFILHRYLMNLFVLVTLLFCCLLFSSSINNSIKCLVASALTLGLWTGNLWTYPPRISTGWDATLAHTPYFCLYSEMLESIDHEFKIPISQIGSAFPNDMTLKYRSLNGDDRIFPEKDLEKHRYILYSNVYNDFTDNEIDELTLRWKALKTLQKGSVNLVLYQRP